MKREVAWIAGAIVVAILSLAAWRLWLAKETPTQVISNRSGQIPVAQGGTTSSQQHPATLATPPLEWGDKTVAMKTIWANENSKSLDTYGIVIDQHGDPVPGAKVRAGVGLYVDFTRSGGEDYYTQTDSKGRFSFLSLHGAGVGFTPEKPGYQFNGRLPNSRPNDYNPNPNNPIVLKMWKIEGTQPMIYTRINHLLPLDGKPASFDLQTGKLATGGGDMDVTYKRNPLNVSSTRPFDWSITFGMSNGGIVEDNDPYPNEAPAEGYKPSITIDMPATALGWSSSLTRSFYFKSRGGQTFGRMSVTITLGGGRQPAPTLFDAVIYANPAGSRNLEFDPAKQISR